MAIERVGDIQVSQDLVFQRRMWVAQRVGWIGMLVVGILALVGYVGHGPLTGGMVGSAATGLEIDYARFARHRADTQLVFTVHPRAIENEQATISINAEYLEGVQVVGTLPQEPDTVSVGPHWVTYTFQVGDATQPVRIVFDIEPVKNGLRTLEARVGAGEPLRVRQFIYP